MADGRLYRALVLDVSAEGHVLTVDRREGVRAFNEKRKPRFTGR